MSLRKTLLPAAAITCILLFSGCPIGMDFPLGDPGSETIDEALIGTWSNDDPDAAVIKVTIRKSSPYTYEVVVNEKGEMYSLETNDFTGYVTTLDGHGFVYFKDADGKYYHYEYTIQGRTEVVTHVASLLVGGVDAVTDTESFREEVSASLKLEGCLTEKTIWVKE